MIVFLFQDISSSRNHTGRNHRDPPPGQCVCVSQQWVSCDLSRVFSCLWMYHYLSLWYFNQRCFDPASVTCSLQSDLCVPAGLDCCVLVSKTLMLPPWPACPLHTLSLLEPRLVQDPLSLPVCSGSYDYKENPLLSLRWWTVWHSDLGRVNILIWDDVYCQAL